MTNTRGRPLASSRAMLQEAAFDLFLQNGYEATTVAEISRVAGVSRNTFFNYFTGKSDVFWVDIDDSANALSASLAAAPADQPFMTAIREALLEVARSFGPGRVPWALTQYTLIGGADQLQASGMSRLADHTRALVAFADAHLPLSARPLGHAACYASLGAALAAARDWASAGTSRGGLEPWLDAALTPLCEGFQRAIDSSAH
jgi:AcrR family transcriptional regulator